MEHRTLQEISAVSVTAPVMEAARAMTRREKLEHWATLIERHEGELRPLNGIEFLSRDKRKILRDDKSPLALAYQDPIFRAQRLKSDQLGDGMAFFELTAREAHCLLCECHWVRNIPGRSLARQVRFAARHPVLSRYFA
jgi:hypothetical protein